MKAKVLTLLFVLITYISFAQGYKENIKKRFNEFYSLTAAGDIEKSMDYIPDSFFAIIPKDKIIDALKQVMNNKNIEYKILDHTITQIGESKLVANNYYSILNYVSNIKMNFKDIDTIKTEDKKQTRLNLIKLSLSNNFGTDNVKLNNRTGTFAILAHKKACAVSLNGQTDWKFINIEARQRLILDKVLPKEIIESL